MASGGTHFYKPIQKYRFTVVSGGAYFAIMTLLSTLDRTLRSDGSFADSIVAWR